MGVFRFLLAILICVMHAKAQKMLPGSLLPDLRGLELDPKINIFFIMAGFFARQSLIYLKTRSLKGCAFSFYRSRMLRLWPAYWVCVLATYICIQYFGMGITPERLMPGAPVWKMVLYNAIPFTHDLLHITSLPNEWPTIILNFVLLQGWTLALIMALFALVPIVFFFTRPLYVLFLASLVGLYHAYFHEMAYQGYVIIALPYFLAGGIAYDVYLRYWAQHSVLSFSVKLALSCAAILLIVIFANYQGLIRMVGLMAANAICVVYAWLLIPGLFQLTRNNRYDIYLSNISYTLYLDHFLVFFAFRQMGGHGTLKYWLILPACILIAILLHELVERPMRAYRKRVR